MADELISWEIKSLVESLQRLLGTDIQATLIIRDPYIPGRHYLYGTDESLKRVLKLYFERQDGKNHG